MSDLDSQTACWDAAAATKTFMHPLHVPWLDGVDRHAAILDQGCGDAENYMVVGSKVQTPASQPLAGPRGCSQGAMNGNESKRIQILASSRSPLLTAGIR